jgi:hypothetical protein
MAQGNKEFQIGAEQLQRLQNALEQLLAVQSTQ